MASRNLKLVLTAVGVLSVASPSFAEVGRVFSIPVTMAAQSDAAYVYAPRGLRQGMSSLGLRLQEVQPQGHPIVWLKVEEVMKGSSFFGLVQPGDVLWQVNGFQFRSFADFIEYSSNLPVDTALVIRRTMPGAGQGDVRGATRAITALAAQNPGKYVLPPHLRPEENSGPTVGQVVVGGLAIAALACAAGLICESRPDRAEPAPSSPPLESYEHWKAQPKGLLGRP